MTMVFILKGRHEHIFLYNKIYFIKNITSIIVSRWRFRLQCLWRRLHSTAYSFRVVSLALRLFANMMSGHCLLKILSGFAWTMSSTGGVLTILHLLPLVVIFAIVGLELSIAFLQAYVFTVLLCIYLNDAISLH